MIKKLLLIALLLIIVAVAWYFLIYKPGQQTTEGDSCSAAGLPGRIKNGVCVALPVNEQTVPCGGKLNPC